MTFKEEAITAYNLLPLPRELETPGLLAAANDDEAWRLYLEQRRASSPLEKKEVKKHAFDQMPLTKEQIGEACKHVLAGEGVDPGTTDVLLRSITLDLTGRRGDGLVDELNTTARLWSPFAVPRGVEVCLTYHDGMLPHKNVHAASACWQPLPVAPKPVQQPTQQQGQQRSVDLAAEEPAATRRRGAGGWRTQGKQKLFSERLVDPPSVGHTNLDMSCWDSIFELDGSSINAVTVQRMRSHLFGEPSTAAAASGTNSTDAGAGSDGGSTGGPPREHGDCTSVPSSSEAGAGAAAASPPPAPAAISDFALLQLLLTMAAADNQVAFGFNLAYSYHLTDDDLAHMADYHGVDTDGWEGVSTSWVEHAARAATGALRLVDVDYYRPYDARAAKVEWATNLVECAYGWGVWDYGDRRQRVDPRRLWDLAKKGRLPPFRR